MPGGDAERLADADQDRVEMRPDGPCIQNSCLGQPRPTNTSRAPERADPLDGRAIDLGLPRQHRRGLGAGDPERGQPAPQRVHQRGHQGLIAAVEVDRQAFGRGAPRTA